MPRKRTYEEMQATDPVVLPETSLLTKIRSMWEFAATMQYIFIFGKAVKIDEDFDIEVCRRRTTQEVCILQALDGRMLLLKKNDD